MSTYVGESHLLEFVTILYTFSYTFDFAHKYQLSNEYNSLFQTIQEDGGDLGVKSFVGMDADELSISHAEPSSFRLGVGHFLESSWDSN